MSKLKRDLGGGGPPRGFDARPDRLDLRDLVYRPPLRSLPPRWPDDAEVARFMKSYVAAGLVLDQGTEGACTGFGLACVANYLLWTRHVSAGATQPFVQVSPRMLYELAKRYDEWPGTDYEGSSCRGALKGWHKHGVCSRTLWPYDLDADGQVQFQRPAEGWQLDAATRPLGVYYRVSRESVVDLQAAIVNIGSVYVSGNVHDGWDALVRKRSGRMPVNHAALPVIAPPEHPRKLGGHSFALVGYDERGFIVQNSWGRVWGASGFAVLPYDDWVVHGTDAWACALGVPVTLRDAGGLPRRQHATRTRVARGTSLTSLDRSTRAAGNPADDPWPIDHDFKYAPYRPLATEEAYGHALVTGNDGQLEVTDFTRAQDDRAGLAEELIVEAPLRWLAANQRGTLKLAIYAHGGLNSEQGSVARIRVLAPYFLANGIYPLFLTWKTGAGETLADMAKDWLSKLFGTEAERATGFLDALGDAKDRAIEALAHVLGKGLWSEMRENAERSKLAGHGVDLLVRNLATLQQRLPRGKTLELHLGGHSAGSILLGHLLDRLGQPPGSNGSLRIDSCTLFAPACSLRFAVEHYLGAADSGVLDLQRLWLAVLSDDNEKRDGLPSPAQPAYGKSLLYLVSRALDDVRKMPLLGLQRALDPRYAKDSEQWDEGELPSVQQWQRRWGSAGRNGAARLAVIDDPRVVCTRETEKGKGDAKTVQATHGSFDNNVELLTAMLTRIKGSKLASEMEWLGY